MHTFRKYFLLFLLLLVVVASATFTTIQILDHHDGQSDEVASEPESEPIIEEDPIPEFIDLQGVVDTWLSGSRYSKASVMIYDLDNDRIAASYNEHAVMLPASLYKLFYVYDGYKWIDAGVDDPEKLYVNLSGTRGWTSVKDCLYLMISESNNLCAEAMLADSTRENRVIAWTKEIGLTDTTSSGLSTSAADLTEVLKMYYHHPDWSEESFATWQTSALNQVTATTDYRIGLPAGFDEQATVYNKVGWSNSTGAWEVYNDAAVIEFPNLEIPRHYIVVIMTSYAGYTQIAKFGTMLEEAIINFDAGGEELIEEAASTITAPAI